jgi:hypothetical protein
MTKKIKENSNIKSFLTDDIFKNDKNKHKYIILWASKFYRLINNIMRKYELDTIMNNSKYTRRFVVKMTKYFFSYGVDAEYLKKKTDTLFRGFDKDFMVPTCYEENGFMSTTFDLSVATRFSGASGNMVTFFVKDLPPDTPFVIIDDTIEEYLNEQEVLFLPGTITTQKTSQRIKATYTMHPMFNIIKDLTVGGGPLQLDVPKIDLKGKYIVWWRAIINRQPEVVGRMEMPKDPKAVQSFFMNEVLPYDDKFQVKNNFIPQYKDLKEKCFKSGLTEEEMDLYSSYEVYMALYDAKTKSIPTINYGIFDAMFSEELFDISRRKEVEEVILQDSKHL